MRLLCFPSLKASSSWPLPFHFGFAAHVTIINLAKCSIFLGENAFLILMQSQKNLQIQDTKPNQRTSNYKCWLCEKFTETMPCTFCEHRICEMCIRQCDRCFGVFCSCCTIVKYDRHEDRALCLGCNNEETKKNRVRAVPHCSWKRWHWIWKISLGILRFLYERDVQRDR